MMKTPLLLALILSLSACGVIERGRDRLFPPKPAQAVQMPETALAPVPEQRLPGSAAGQSAEALDATTEAERAAAVAAPAPAAGAAALGTVLVTLGSPAEQGFWMQTALVGAPGRGRVVAANGASVAVDLRPGTGGAQLSLAAFRALNLPLTGLPEVTVYAE